MVRLLFGSDTATAEFKEYLELHNIDFEEPGLWVVAAASYEDFVVEEAERLGGQLTNGPDFEGSRGRRGR